MVYFIATVFFSKTDDIKSYRRYTELVKPIVKRHNGHYITRSEKITALSNDWTPDRVIIIAFDNKEQLRSCFSSPEYSAIAALREASVRSSAIIIE